MQDSITQLPSRTTSALASLFFHVLTQDPSPTFEAFGDEAIDMGHAAMEEVMGAALEHYDSMLCAELPDNASVRGMRTLATEIGDASFSWRRASGPLGASCRLQRHLIRLGVVAYHLARPRFLWNREPRCPILGQRACSRVSPTTVMNILRRGGGLREREDEAFASSLHADGALPEAKVEAEEVCVEADRTWIRLQNTAPGKPERIEVKAIVAYSDKVSQGNKVKRDDAVRRGCAASPGRFWPQSIAAIAQKFDLAKVGRVHLGTDGEGWCKRGGGWFPLRVEVRGHLDLFHVNRAVLSCFKDPKAVCRVLEALLNGEEEQPPAFSRPAGIGVLPEKRTQRG